MVNRIRLSPAVDRRAMLIGAGLGVAVLLIMVWLTRAELSGLGVSMTPGAILILLTDLWIPLLWLAAAAGFGVALHRLMFGREYDDALIIALGVGAMLWLDHALGLIGFLQASGGVGAWMLDGVGVALLLALGRDVLRDRQARPREWNHSWAALVAAPGIATLIVAATSAPGWLWLSEAHGYDVLSYHLQLPREWLALERVRPLEHNVYSFLPSYTEAAFYHIAIQFQPFRGAFADGAIRGAIACQLLHAMLTLLLAFVVVAPAIARRAHSGFAGVISGALIVNLPWIIVVGSMAYNEIPTLLMLGAGLSALFDQRARRWSELVALGLLMGLACAAKPTAIGFVAAPLFAATLVVKPRPRIGRLIAGGAMGGVIALAPWLIRNAIFADGNPLFPFATSVFGAAHWSAEQAARWSAAHHVDLSLAARLERFVDFIALHRQWAGLWIIGALAMVIGIARPRFRRETAMLAIALLVQIIFWFGFTHMQSRFLLPAAVPIAMAVPLALIQFGRDEQGEPRPRRFAVARLILIAIALGMGTWSVRLFTQERDGLPATFVDGLSLRTRAYAQTPGGAIERDQVLPDPDAFLSYLTGDEYGLLLIGDATPFYIQRPVRYHTTWDTSPLGELIRAHPDDPNAWADGLIDQGVRLILVDFAELDRLINKDHWYDPDVTIERVQRLVNERATAVMAWPLDSERPYQILYRLNPAGSAPAATGANESEFPSSGAAPESDPEGGR